MNKKEVGEIRRHVRRDRCNMAYIYGCYVGDENKVISEFELPVGTMPENEQEKYMALFKRVLGGTLGKNLMDISFATAQVGQKEGPHSMLMELREKCLKNSGDRKAFYRAVMDSVQFDGRYVILLGCDAYDVPFKDKNDDRQAEAGDEVFRYILCAICPVKDVKPNLHYIHEEASFHDGGMLQAIKTPELGFMFPAFNDRSADIYGALYHCRKPTENYPKFVQNIFGVRISLTADAQQQAFGHLLRASLKEECNMSVMGSLYAQAQDCVALHKEAKVAEPLVATADQIGDMLVRAGVSSQKCAAFKRAFSQVLGEQVHLENIFDIKHYDVDAGNAVIRVAPDVAGEVETRKIGGVDYVLVPVNGCVFVNGVELFSENE